MNFDNMTHEQFITYVLNNQDLSNDQKLNLVKERMSSNKSFKNWLAIDLKKQAKNEKLAENLRDAFDSVAINKMEKNLPEEAVIQETLNKINSKELDFPRLKEQFTKSIPSESGDKLAKAEMYSNAMAAKNNPNLSPSKKEAMVGNILEFGDGKEDLQYLKTRELAKQLERKGIAQSALGKDITKMSNIDKYIPEKIKALKNFASKLNSPLARQVKQKLGKTFFQAAPIVGPAVGIATALATGDASAAMPMGFESEAVGEGSDVIPEQSVYDRPTEQGEMTPERFRRLSSILNSKK